MAVTAGGVVGIISADRSKEIESLAGWVEGLSAIRSGCSAGIV